MKGQFFKFGCDETEKKKFSLLKLIIDFKPINVDNMDIKKILVAGEFTHAKNKETDAKYFTVFKTGKKNYTIIHYTPANE